MPQDAILIVMRFIEPLKGIKSMYSIPYLGSLFPPLRWNTLNVGLWIIASATRIRLEH